MKFRTVVNFEVKERKEGVTSSFSFLKSLGGRFTHLYFIIR